MEATDGPKRTTVKKRPPVFPQSAVVSAKDPKLGIQYMYVLESVEHAIQDITRVVTRNVGKSAYLKGPFISAHGSSSSLCLCPFFV